VIREAVIRDLVRGKKVLDVGSVGQTASYSLWSVLKESASELVGIDVAGSGMEGVVCGNMETYDFKRKFDVVVAGDVIEHVENQGLFLDNVRRHMVDDGILILTTPNAKWWTVFLRPNATHVLWHDEYTLRRLLDVHGFRVDRLFFYPGNKRSYLPLLLPFIIRQSILAVCSKKPQAGKRPRRGR